MCGHLAISLQSLFVCFFVSSLLTPTHSQGAPGCLADTTWVLTGELETMTRDVATKVIADHGGKVTSE